MGRRNECKYALNAPTGKFTSCSRYEYGRNECTYILYDSIDEKGWTQIRAWGSAGTHILYDFTE